MVWTGDIWVPSVSLVQDMLCMYEYLASFQPRYVEEIDQVLNYIETQGPHPIMGLMIMMTVFFHRVLGIG